MKEKYDIKDLELIECHKKSIDEIANKYKVSHNAVLHALKSRHIRIRTKKILITSSFFDKPIVCRSILQASKKLGVSRNTIVKALKNGSESIRIFKELDVNVEVVKWK